jgi:cell division protein FtsA
MVDKEMMSMKRNRKVPGGLVITGGGAKLKRIAEMAKKIFKIPVSIGWPKNVNLMIDKANDPIFTTAIGLIQWGKELGAVVENQEVSAYKTIKNIFKKFLP